MVVGTLTTAWSSSTVGDRATGGLRRGSGGGRRGCLRRGAGTEDEAGGGNQGQADAERTGIGRAIARDVPVKVVINSLSCLGFRRTRFYRFSNRLRVV